MRPLARVCSLFFLAGLSACQSDSATQRRAAPPAAPFTITVEGIGSKTTRTVGSGACANSFSTVRVDATISHGLNGNTIKGEAFCGKASITRATATDPGGGPAGAANASGVPAVSTTSSCVVTYTAKGMPDSNWLVTCEFK